MSKLTIITLAAATIVSASAQDRPLVFHVGAELVVLDVIATDANGREVSDLTRSDIQMSGGRLAAAGSAAAAGLARGAAARSTACRPAGAGGAGRCRLPPARRLRSGGLSVVIVVDLNSIPADAMPRVDAAILDLLAAGTPGRALRDDRGDQRTAGGGPVVHDRSRAAAPACSASRGASAPDRHVPAVRALDRICGIAGASDVVNMGVAVGQDIVTEGNRRMLYTTYALTGLAQSLDAMPGRKHIVLYSGGYTLNLVTACDRHGHRRRVRLQRSGHPACPPVARAAVGDADAA